MTFFPIVELVDRYCIAMLKFYKTSSNIEELDFYKVQVSSLDLENVEQELKTLYDIHSEIWSLESELKSGVEQNLPLEEIGRRAIQIRNWNNRRIATKNAIASKLGCNIQEIKKDHLSQ